MHVVVVGASGSTGRHVVTQALEAGHRVTALVRDPTRYQPPEGVDVRKADVVTDPELPLPSDADAVISALGKTSMKDPTSTCFIGVAHLLDAMRERGLGRIVVISAQPVLRSGDGLSWFSRYLLFPLVRFWGRNIYPDLERMERLLRKTDTWCDWTIIRPGYLEDAQEAARFRLAPEVNVPGSTRRPDLAAALVQVTADESTHRRAYGVASA